MATATALDPCTDPAWARLATEHGTLFHSPGWLGAIRDAFGITPVAHTACQGRAGLVVGHVDDELGSRRVTFPFTDYCGPIGVTDQAQWHELAGASSDPSVPYRIRLRTHPVVERDDRLIEQGRYAWHGLALAGDQDERWAALAPAARQNIRRARRAGVVVDNGSSREALARFERLHIGLRRRKYRMLAQPPEYFDALHHHFGADLVVLEGQLDATTVAAVVLIRWGDTAYYKFNASNLDASTSRANDLLMWEAMVHARDVWGCELLDLGLSDLDQPGLLRYKSKYATADDQIITYATATPPGAQAAAVRSVVDTTVGLVTGDDVPEEVAIDASRALYRLFC